MIAALSTERIVCWRHGSQARQILATVLLPLIASGHGRRGRQVAVQDLTPASLVARGYVTGLTLARTLAEQHGLDPTPMREVDVSTAPAASAETFYAVRHLGAVLHESPNFLDAADFASELVQRGEADVLEIQRTRDGVRETVWSYSRPRADATPCKTLMETFGFDPTRWRG